MDNSSAVGLTPIRVRGRKVRRPEETPSKRKNGQPHARLIPHNKTKKQKTKMGKLSHLESLPAELIEQIFLQCLEFNLPRASPRLAASLSRERLFRALILYALWADNDTSHFNSAAVRPVRQAFRPLNYTPISPRLRYTLQSSIFACQWCTYERVRGYLKDLVELSLARWLYVHGRDIENLGVDEPKLETIARWTEKHVFSWRPLPKDGRFGVVECSIDPSYFHQLMQMSSLTEGYGPIQPVRPPARVEHPVELLLIPDKLVNGTPWSDKKISFLQLLRGWCDPVPSSSDLGQGNILPSFKPYSEGQLQNGIHTAIIEHNPIALRSLLELDETLKAGLSFLFNHYDEPLYTIPPGHFFTAVRSSDDPEMFRMLIRGSAESLPRDDPEITAWAMRLDSRGESFGRWLLNLMAGPAKPDGFKMFKRGQLGPHSTLCEAQEVSPHGYMDTSVSYEDAFGARPMSWQDEILEPLDATLQNEQKVWTLET